MLKVDFSLKSVYKITMSKAIPTTTEAQLREIICADNARDRSSAVIQETPICLKCLEVINIASDRVNVNYIDLRIGERTYKLAEPICPFCGEIVEARYHIIN